MLLEDLTKAAAAADARKEASEPLFVSEEEAEGGAANVTEKPAPIGKLLTQEPSKTAAPVAEEAAPEPAKAAEVPKVPKTDPARVAELRAKLEAEKIRVSTEQALKAKEKAEREAKLLQENPAMAALEKAREVEAENAALRKQIADSQAQAQYEAHKEKVKSYIDKNDKYEYIQKTGESDMVLNLMVQHYNDTNELLSEEDACDIVEAHLEKIADKFAKTNKLKAKFKDSTPSSTTLTNRLAQENPVAIVKPEKILLSYDERMEAMKETFLRTQRQ